MRIVSLWPHTLAPRRIKALFAWTQLMPEDEKILKSKL